MIELDACLVCGCSDEEACPGGCAWVLPGVCSACVDPFLERLVALLELGQAAVHYRQQLSITAGPAALRAGRGSLLAAAGAYKRVLDDQRCELARSS